MLGNIFLHAMMYFNITQCYAGTKANMACLQFFAVKCDFELNNHPGGVNTEKLRSDYGNEFILPTNAHLLLSCRALINPVAQSLPSRHISPSIGLHTSMLVSVYIAQILSKNLE